jgi:hypothetical protein
MHPLLLPWQPGMTQSVYFVLFHSVQIVAWAYGAVPFPQRLSDRGVKLATHLHLVPLRGHSTFLVWGKYSISSVYGTNRWEGVSGIPEYMLNQVS